MTPGQDPDTAQEHGTLEDRLERNLRAVASKGISLTSEHYKGMPVLLSLKDVLMESVPVVGNRQASLEGVRSGNPEPQVVRNMIRKAIGRLAKANDDELATHRAELCLRIFSIDRRSHWQDADERLENLVEYYNDYLNLRKKPCELSNFARRVYGPEIVRPLAREILKWNMELRDESTNDWRHVSELQRWVSRAWGEQYWWLFRLHYHLRQAVLLILGHASSQESIDVRCKMALHEIAMFLRCAPWDPFPKTRIVPGYVTGAEAAADRALRSVGSWFLLSKYDEAWLDWAIGVSYENLPPAWHSSRQYFYQLLTIDPHGSSIAQKLLTYASDCDCMAEGSRSEFERENEPDLHHTCSLRAFFNGAKQFEMSLMGGWFEEATSQQSLVMMDFERDNVASLRSGASGYSDLRRKNSFVPHNSTRAGH